MIKLYGVKLSQLPDRRTLISALGEELYSAWKERHKSTRDERTARASLAGILLLKFAGVRQDFFYDSNGRPCSHNSRMDFNITHTEKLVLCAVETAEADTEIGENPPDMPYYPEQSVHGDYRKQLFSDRCRVGLDAEDLGRLSSVRTCPIAERWFSQNEREFFLSQPNDRTFLRIWTRKEALAKWTGEGLSGLRKADTVSAPSMYGIRFYEYLIGDTVITLCCHADTVPPAQIHMLTGAEVLDLI